MYGVCNSKNFPRLPVPGLWLDIFQKIRALGYTGVSFYVDWALLEGYPGTFKADGVFDLNPFFEAATQAGIYLLAVSDIFCAMD
jgi:beta-galactosidase GanA